MNTELLLNILVSIMVAMGVYFLIKKDYDMLRSVVIGLVCSAAVYYGG